MICWTELPSHLLGNFTITRRAQFLVTSRWHPQITQIFASETYCTPTYLASFPRPKIRICILGVYGSHFKIFRYASRSFLVKILAAKYYARGRKFFPAKKLSIWFWAGKFFPTLSPPHPSNYRVSLSPTLLPFLYLPYCQILGAVVVATRCLCCCLRILELGGLELLNSTRS
jgi:hypothetical protein